jgi:phage repressor protein C with HTH and peptisase S24 domain
LSSYRQVRVVGESMLPTLADGDLVLVYLTSEVRPEQLVLVRWPDISEQLHIKRAMWAEEGGWFVVGDNYRRSTDSNHYGPATVIGVVRWRLWPRPKPLR